MATVVLLNASLQGSEHCFIHSFKYVQDILEIRWCLSMKSMTSSFANDLSNPVIDNSYITRLCHKFRLTTKHFPSA